MQRQLFVVTLEVPPDFGPWLSRVDAGQMAGMICHGVWAKSCSFVGPVPFKITVERVDEVAAASGEMREYGLDQFNELPEEPGVILRWN